jgi:hypothetical protein
MARSMRLRVWIATAVMVVVAGVAAASAVAATSGVGWSLHSLAEPTNFNATDTKDTVYQLTVNATEGTYELHLPSPPGEPERRTAPIQWDASPAEVQTALEALPEVGAGNVSVTGGPGGSAPYAITWDGAQSGHSLGFLGVEENQLKNGAAQGTATTTTIQQPEVPDRFGLVAFNVGSRSSEGPVTIADKLPAGVVPVEIEMYEKIKHADGNSEIGEGVCSLTELKCTYSGPVLPGGELVVEIHVAVTSPLLTGPLVNEATVAGGGASEVSASSSSAVNVGPASFGVAAFSFEADGVEGALDAQAGDHPYGVTSTIALNTLLVFAPAIGTFQPHVVRSVKSVGVELPSGFAGDPLATERCPEIDLTDTVGTIGNSHFHTVCPLGSVVGEISLQWAGGNITGRTDPYPVYNVIPEHGYPAELGFNVGSGQPVFVYASVVPTASGYRLRVSTPGAIRAKGLEPESIRLRIFGDLGSRSGAGGQAAFVRNPTRCSNEPLNTTLEVSAWEGGLASSEATAYPEVSGCGLLQGAAAFDPSLSLGPEVSQADSPSGYHVDVKIPQAPSVFGALGTPDLRGVTVTLPAGVSISPAAASGPNALEGCTAAQIDLLGTELGEGHPGGNGSPYDDGLVHASPGHCPAASILGTVEALTPILPGPLVGHVYLAAPACGGEGQPVCTEALAEEGKVFDVYVEVAGSGVIIKQAGSLEVGGYGGHNGLAVGQLRARFQDITQQPVEELQMTLASGPRAPLANPQTCGTASTTSDLMPWSAPGSGPDATPSSSFTVTGCPGGGLGFAPGFTAGTVQSSAGAFSPFTLSLTRHDGEQDLAGLSVTLPPGIAGILAGIPLCGETQAQAASCPEASRVGTATVASGAGSQPLWLSGPVYLTGPYRGAPFGLAVVVPAKAGPVNLGDVVVRAAITVNPHTAQVAVSSDPLPQNVDGIPVRLKTVNVTVDRPGFIYNPTNCSAMQVTGTVSGDQPDGTPGASAGVSSPFAAAGCANLPFHPTFKVSTSGKTSKHAGASLTVNVTSGAGQANIHTVAVTLPKQLPSRLTTIQQACREATFAANPASCPEGSVVGTVTARTPVLSAPLTGPAYLVSRGGAAFPNIVFVLQGDGVTLEVVGRVNIRKGVTSSTFESVPDAPIEGFKVVLPEGPHSALGAIGDLCKSKLTMPTTLVGQNGAELHQSTRIAMTGCPKAKKKAKRKSKRAKGKPSGRPRK